MATKRTSDRHRAVASGLGRLNREIPAVTQAFAALHKTAVSGEHLGRKTAELIAIGVAVATHCDDCIIYHVRDALEAGATREEILEAGGVGILMGGGPALMYASHLVDIVDGFEAGDAPAGAPT